MKRIKSTFIALLTVLGYSASAQVPVVTQITGPSTVCSGQSHTFTAHASNSPTSYNWVITPMGSLNSFVTNGNQVMLNFIGQLNTYTLTVSASNGSGTSATYSFVITVWETPQVTFSGWQSGICQGSTTMFQASPTMFSASPTISYSWTPSAGLSYTSGPSVYASPLVSTNYTVFFQASSCMNSAVLPLMVHPLPVVSASLSQDTICTGEGSMINFSGTATSYSVNWNPASWPYMVSPLSSTLYQIQGSTQHGCYGSTQVYLTVYQSPTLTVSGNPLCQGDSTYISISGNGSSYYLNNQLIQTTHMIKPLVTTTYVIVAQGLITCSTSTQYVQTVLPRPVISATSERSLICAGETVQVNINGNAVSYLLGTNLTQTSFTIAPATTSTYNIKGMGANGCESDISFVQKVDKCSGLSAHQLQHQLIIYPNPSAGEVYIRSEVDQELHVYDISGRLVRSVRLETAKPATLEQLPAGTYIIQAETGSHKLIISP